MNHLYNYKELEIEAQIMKKRILILGAGFGGLRAAFSLSKRLKKEGLDEKLEVVVVDKSDYHTYTPLLYEVATTPENIVKNCGLRGLATHNLKEVFKGKEINFIVGEVVKIDLQLNRVFLKSGHEISFDFLVIGLGAETNFFDLPGVKKWALPLKTYNDAVNLRARLVKLDNSFGAHKENFSRGKVVVCGGGPTGVELVAEIKNWLPNLDVLLVDAANFILRGFNEKIVGTVTKRLVKLGVKVQSDFLISEAGYGKIAASDGREVLYDVLIWTAGIRATLFLEESPLKKDPVGRIETGRGMDCYFENNDFKVSARIYAVGDLSCFYRSKNKTALPSIAQVAIEQGDVAARNIIQEIKIDLGIIKKATPIIYEPKEEYAYVLPVGGKFAVAKIGGLVVSGFLGWLVKGLVELRYLVSILPPLKAFRVWLKGLVVFTKNDKLG